MKDVWLPLSTPRQASPQVPGSTDRNYTALKIHNKLLLKSYQPVNFEHLMIRLPNQLKNIRHYLESLATPLLQKALLEKSYNLAKK
jgi:hypothetical protein